MNRRFAAGIALLFLSACAPAPPAPVFEADGLAVEEKPEPKVRRPKSHKIRSGETLIDIALQYGLEYRELALWNGIANPDSIHAGDILQLSPPKRTAVAAPVKAAKAPKIGGLPTLQPAPKSEIIAVAPPVEKPAAPPPGNAPVKDAPVAAKYAYDPKTLKKLRAEHTAPSLSAPQPAAPAAPSQPVAAAGAPKKVRRRFDIDWSWPAFGAVAQKFSDATKGLDISGKKGEAVYASADGKVVYVGTGVKSYGRLIIIKHKNDYLSAYAHNNKILVREGQRVARGNQIATVGDSGAAQTMLHLEIRKSGKPIDPLQVLPPKP